MGTILIIIGALLIVIAGIVYLYQNPQVLGQLGKSLQRSEVAVRQARQAASTPASQARVRTGYLSGKASFVERLKDLPAGTMLTVRMLDGSTATLQVKTRVTIHSQTQYGGKSSPWTRDGSRWHGLLCKGNPGVFPGDVLILQLTNGYLFSMRVRLGPEEARQFQLAAQRFVAGGQVAGSQSMKWRSVSYAIQDVGVFDVESLDDDGHVPQDLLIRFIIAHDDGKTAVYVEDSKGGDNDSVWMGRVGDLNEMISDMLTPEGD